MGNILGFGGTAERRKIAENKAESGDFLSALGHLYSALKENPEDLGVIEDLADVYADMGLLELSNKFWLKYLDVAPQNKKSVAYEELAINFFYMDNVWAAGYYFHLKVAEDGFIAEEGLDEEIINFFSEASSKSSYRLVYPYERADYSDTVKAAKRSLACGDYKTAIYLYKSLPEVKFTEEIAGDYAVALFLDGQDKEVIDVCKSSVEKFGPNLTAYCNLSTLFKAKGEDEKSAVYYALAKNCERGEDGEKYKLATCAIEQQDDDTVSRCVGEILKERPYDDIMNFFCGVALINLGKVEDGCKKMATARRINPSNRAYKFYYEYALKLSKTGIDEENLLPFKYSKELPKKTEKELKRSVKRLLDITVLPKSLRKETFEQLLLGLNCGSPELAQDCTFLLGVHGGEKGAAALLDFVINPEVDEEIKKIAVYNLINCGRVKKFGVTAGNFFVKVKLGKLLSRGMPQYEFFTCGYAISMARAVFAGVDDFNKITFAANKLFVLCGEKLKDEKFSPEEVAALITLTFKPNKVSVSDICKTYRVDKDRVGKFFEIYSNHKGGING